MAYEAKHNPEENIIQLRPLKILNLIDKILNLKLPYLLKCGLQHNYRYIDHHRSKRKKVIHLKRKSCD